MDRSFQLLDVNCTKQPNAENSNVHQGCWRFLNAIWIQYEEYLFYVMGAICGTLVSWDKRTPKINVSHTVLTNRLNIEWDNNLSFKNPSSADQQILEFINQNRPIAISFSLLIQIIFTYILEAVNFLLSRKLIFTDEFFLSDTYILEFHRNLWTIDDDCCFF